MNLLVNTDRVGLSEGLAADFASKRLLATVDAHVDTQSGLTAKNFATGGTLQNREVIAVTWSPAFLPWHCFCVGFAVLAVRCESVEMYATALQLARLVVYPHVGVEVGRLGKAPAALFALVRLLASVNAEVDGVG